MNIEDIELVQTCGACPEQYDAFYNNKMVGYFRLRWGNFTVDYPDVYGTEIYSHSFDGDGFKGMFDPDEREYFLNKAKEAIVNHINSLNLNQN